MRSLIRAASLGCLLVFWAIGAKAQTGITLGTPTAVTGASDPTYSEACPSWSPDDKWLVFCSNQYGNNDIFKVDVTTGIVTRLTTNAAPESFPSWSPEGQKILFQRSVGSTSEIWVMNQDGTGQQRLTSGYRDGEASFSPDGSKILFAGWRPPASDYGIFTMNPDGSAVTWFTVLGAHPKWSRDGSRIAFERYYQFGVWVMNADGTGLHACSPRTNNSNDGGGGIDWSPSDCGYLVYTVNSSFAPPATNCGLAVINSISCSGQNQILPFESGCQLPAWSHDGAKLAYHKFDGSQNDIYVTELLGCAQPTQGSGLFGFVFDDLDDDRYFDGSEDAVPNAIVYLREMSDFNNILAVATASSIGFYELEYATPGYYIINIVMNDNSYCARPVNIYPGPPNEYSVGIRYTNMKEAYDCVGSLPSCAAELVGIVPGIDLWVCPFDLTNDACELKQRHESGDNIGFGIQAIITGYDAADCAAILAEGTPATIVDILQEAVAALIQCAESFLRDLLVLSCGDNGYQCVWDWITSQGNRTFGAWTGSPVELRILGEAGGTLRYVGPGEQENTLEEDGYMVQLGSANLAFVNNPSNIYEVQVIGLSSALISDVFDLSFLFPTQDDSYSETTYLNVPTGPNAIAKCKAGAGAFSKLLAVDLNADGVTDYSVLPTYTSDSGIIEIAVITVGGSPEVGVTADIYDDCDHLVAEVVTDYQGVVVSPKLMAGTYRVAIVTPLGFQADQEVKEVTIFDTSVELDYTLTRLDITPNQKPRSYWVTQIQKALAGTPRDYTLAQFSGFAAQINKHFNENRVNQINFYEVPQPATQTDSLELLRQILTMTVPNSTEPFLKKYANAELMAVMLNVIAGKISQTQVISLDDRTVSQAITYCDYLINGIPSEMAEYIELGSDSLWPHRRAQSVAYSINTGQMVSAGKIPAEVADIAYRSEVRQPVVSLSTEFELMPNHPNPFNPSTTIEFAIPTASDVQIEVYNIAGQKVATLVNSRLEAGNHSITWDSRSTDGEPLASGIYLYRLKAGDFVETRKMMLLK